MSFQTDDAKRPDNTLYSKCRSSMLEHGLLRSHPVPPGPTRSHTSHAVPRGPTRSQAVPGGPTRIEKHSLFSRHVYCQMGSSDTLHRKRWPILVSDLPSILVSRSHLKKEKEKQKATKGSRP